MTKKKQQLRMRTSKRTYRESINVSLNIQYKIWFCKKGRGKEKIK